MYKASVLFMIENNSKANARSIKSGNSPPPPCTHITKRNEQEMYAHDAVIKKERREVDES